MPWELLEYDVDVDENYVRLKAQEGWESVIDHRQMSLMQKPTIELAQVVIYFLQLHQLRVL